MAFSDGLGRCWKKCLIFIVPYRNLRQSLDWRMEPHPLEELVQDLAQLVACTGIRLEFLANHYLAVRRGESFGTQHAGTNIELYDKGRRLPSFTSARENESRHEEEQIKRSAFTYYLKQHQERIEKQFPHYTHNQIITKAAVEFKTLPRVQKIQYLRLLINESKQQGLENNQGRQLPDFLDPHQHFDQFPDLRHQQSVTNGYVSSRYLNPSKKEIVLDQQREYARGYTVPLNGYGFDGRTGAEWIGDDFKMQNIQELGVGKGSIDLQGGAERDEKDEGREKNDIYKIVLGHKSSERQERSQPKGQENKEKSEFPTLKSLFKKLQNTS